MAKRIRVRRMSFFQKILVNGLCTGGVDEEECKVELPGFWAAIAAVLWPGYWDPKVHKSMLPNGPLS